MINERLLLHWLKECDHNCAVHIQCTPAWSTSVLVSNTWGNKEKAQRLPEDIYLHILSDFIFSRRSSIVSCREPSFFALSSWAREPGFNLIFLSWKHWNCFLQPKKCIGYQWMVWKMSTLQFRWLRHLAAAPMPFESSKRFPKPRFDETVSVWPVQGGLSIGPLLLLVLVLFGHGQRYR